MKITKQARREAKELFRATLVNGVLDENRVRQAVRLLIERQPRGYLAILGHFQRLIKLEIERRTARVESAIPMEAELENSVRQSLIRAYGPDLKVVFSHNPALIGGLRVRVGSDVYDGSVAGRLNALKESF